MYDSLILYFFTVQKKLGTFATYYHDIQKLFFRKIIYKLQSLKEKNILKYIGTKINSMNGRSKLHRDYQAPKRF